MAGVGRVGRCVRSFRDGVGERYESLSGSADPNEAVTEQELIRPVLELLGWADYLPQQPTRLHEDVPDHLLFPDASAKARAAAKGGREDRFSDALVSRRASGSACPSMPATRTAGAGRGRRTVRFSATFRRLRETPTATSTGGS